MDGPIDHRISRGAIAGLAGFVVGLHALANAMFFDRYGRFASAGADIWFFVGVAKGYYHLFGADPVGWLLALLRGCSPEKIFVILLALANALHVLTAFLLFGLLREVYRDERAAGWATAIFSTLSSSFLFTTGTLVHQQAVLPILVGIVWSIHRFLTGPTEKRVRYAGWAGGLTILGVCIGPDTVVWVETGLLALVAWHFRNRGIPPVRLAIAAVLLLVVGIGLIGARPLLEKAAVVLAARARGIDLLAQRALFAGDLMPFDRERFIGTYPWVGLGLIALILYAGYRGRLVEVTLVIIPVLFSFSIVRFFFLAELGLAVLIAWWLARELPPRARIRNVVGTVLVLLFLGTAIARGFTCLCPSTLYRTLVRVREDPVRKMLVFCNPSYGFVVRAVTGEQPTADMHRLNSNAMWMKMAARPADEAAHSMRERGVTHLLLTSHDFRIDMERGPDGRPVMGTYCSGGLERTLPRLSPEELRFTLVYQALAASFPIAGTRLLEVRTDPSTHMKMVLYRLE